MSVSALCCVVICLVSASVGNTTVVIRTITGLEYPEIRVARLMPWFLGSALAVAVHCRPLQQMRFSARPIRLLTVLHWFWLLAIGGACVCLFNQGQFSAAARDWMLSFGLASLSSVWIHRTLAVLLPSCWALAVFIFGMSEEAGVAYWWNTLFSGTNDTKSWLLATGGLAAALVSVAVKPIASEKSEPVDV